MQIIVGSKKSPKVQAVEESFRAVFPNEEISIDGVATDSGVSSHPTSADDTLAGALNRAEHARRLVSDADYYVGIEGGLVKVVDRVWEVGVIAVIHSSGVVSTGVSAGIEVRGAILEAIESGTELSDVIEQKFGIESIGATNGFYGLATNDLVTRQAAYEQAITFALAPFLHPELYAE